MTPILKYNYHTHTYRCGHAVGKEEEYILSAINMGIKRLGISDHIFLPHHSQLGIRGDIDELDGYLSSLKYLREKYKDKIEIKIGFEAEYLPSYLSYYQSLLDNHDIDYLILGQHCYEENDELKYYFRKDQLIDGFIRYVDDVIKGMETGLFKYVAHPDLFYNSCKDLDFYELEKGSRRIIEKAIELNIPLEINMCGMRKKNYDPNTHYPSNFFFILAREYQGVKFVYGVDAHDPEWINYDYIKKLIDFSNGLDLDVIDDYYI
ncbi:MAG: histidinol-phosphatase [Bacilli bacterium]|nr:histidinol-phosphatase [Bacilli bacterium]